MGLFDFVKSQFIEVIEWTDSSNDTLVYRFPVQGNEIKMGAQLIVREGQAAIFINEGAIADVFEPGRHTLSTQNMPILSKLKAWKYGFNSPFKAEVYFVSTRMFTDQKWGTANPVMMRDPEFGMVRIRAFGIFSMRIKDPARFLKDVVGTDGYFTTEEITGQLKRMIVSSFSSEVGSSRIPVLDLAGNYDKLGVQLKARVSQDFLDHGLELVKLHIENISLPPEVEKAIDQRSSMGAVGAANFAQFQMANNMGRGGNGGGGVANAAAEMAMGVAMGQQMMQAFNQPAQFQQAGGFQQGAGQQPAPQAAPAADAGAEERFFILARTALKNTKGELNSAMQGMLDGNRKRNNLSEERAKALIDKARAELGYGSPALDEYKEILMVFMADGLISDEERALLVERQIELGLTDDQVHALEAQLGKA